MKICVNSKKAKFVILNYIHKVTSKQQRCQDVGFISRSKECRSTAD
jgi:hypothetical protein